MGRDPDHDVLSTDASPNGQEPPPVADPPASWRRVDLGPVLDGTWQRPRPAVGRRDDGAGLFYPGKLHAIAAEAEAGKTWLGLSACDDELRRGNGVVFIDFEDDAGATVGRLVSMRGGTGTEAIRERFAYVRPEEPLTMWPCRDDLLAALGDLRPTLVIIDGVTEAMTLHGLEMRDNTDVAKFGRLLPRLVTKAGAACVLLDHVVKDRDGRSGYAIGGIHKLNGIDGAMYVLESGEPFGLGLTGRSQMLIRKDRPALLRQRAQPPRSRGGLWHYADLVVKSHGEEFAEVSLPPAEAGPAGSDGPPRALMRRVCEVIGDGRLSGAAIEGAVDGYRATTVRWAVETLVHDGYVRVAKEGNAKIHTLIRPFDD